MDTVARVISHCKKIFTFSSEDVLITTSFFKEEKSQMFVLKVLLTVLLCVTLTLGAVVGLMVTPIAVNSLRELMGLGPSDPTLPIIFVASGAIGGIITHGVIKQLWR